jgi:hypothetical protein
LFEKEGRFVGVELGPIAGGGNEEELYEGQESSFEMLERLDRIEGLFCHTTLWFNPAIFSQRFA